jgi:hypothetical protein
MMTTPAAVFLHYLDRLRALLLRVDQADPAIATHRLHADMAPLIQQARTAIGFSLRTCCPLAGRDTVRFGDHALSLTGVLRELDETVHYLSSIPAQAFDGMAGRTIDSVAGFADLHLPGDEFFLQYALPNFFFHYTMVYAIARQAGVDIGKADFDGYHQYPAGFSFR